MHIEIGIISPEKLAYAGVAATALLGAHTMGLLKMLHNAMNRVADLSRLAA